MMSKDSIGLVAGVGVPPRLYEYDFDMLLGGTIVYIKDRDLVKPSLYSRIDVSFTPEFMVVLEEMAKFYGITHKRSFYGALAPYALSVFEHEYHTDLQTLKDARTNGFFGGQFKEVVEKYAQKHHFFDEVRGRGRSRRDVYGLTNQVIAPVGENAQYFNLSSSDMMMVMLAGVLVRWCVLPEDGRVYFEDVNKQFKDFSTRFVSPLST